MRFKITTPRTPSQRHLIQINRILLKKKPLLKTEIKGKVNKSGRNNSGKITIRHKGGGHKQRYRKINFSRKIDSTGIICGIEYDPNRNSNIASVYDYNKKIFFYILAPQNLKEGDIVKSGNNAEAKLGHSLTISEIPVGSFIFNVSTSTKKEGRVSRSAGTFTTLTEKTLDYAKIQLSSGEVRYISPKCFASIGIVSNELYVYKKAGKAGRSRWSNVRPNVRGVAMNPIDHPHGGGEGRKSGKGYTPWGKPVKSGKTSKSKNKLIIKKHNE